MKAIRRPEIPPTIIATTANPGIFPKTRNPIVVADGPFPIPLPPPVDDIIGAIKRFEVEAKKEKKEMKQKVESMEEKYKRLMDDFDKYESFETKLDNLDLNMRSENKKVRGEFRKRDKSLFYMVSKKFQYSQIMVKKEGFLCNELKEGYQIFDCVSCSENSSDHYMRIWPVRYFIVRQLDDSLGNGNFITD